MLRCFSNRYVVSNSSCPESIISYFLNAISSCNSVECCRMIHGRIIKTVNYSDGFIGDRLVSVYMMLNCYEDAQNLFDVIPDKDLISWNNLISRFSQRGKLDKCLNVFSKMRSEKNIRPNEVSIMSIVSACTRQGSLNEAKFIHGFAEKTGFLAEIKVVNSLIDMYGKFGFLNEAYRLFELTQSICNLVTWNSMISIHVQNGFAEKAMDLFILTRRGGFNPDQATILALIQTCVELGIRKLAETIHGLIFSCGLVSIVAIETAMLTLYAKLGRLDYSQNVFNEMKCLDHISWTAMLAGYAIHGCGQEAIQIFESMVKEKNIKPDHVTFIHLLSACSHSGLVDGGKKYFKIMTRRYKIEPSLDHYSCMVDLLGRSGLLNDAYMLIKSMPIEPNFGVWGALLGACRVHRDIEMAKEIAEKLINLNPKDCRNYVMLSNVYSAAGLFKEASKARTLMRENGVIRYPGCSFIEHGGKIIRFVVGDRSHPDSEKIHSKLKEILTKIREAGFLPKIEFDLHDVEGEVKEGMINQHSEKLALAFGLLVSDAKEPIIITKNLRICGDCHSTAKAVSLIEKRRIIIRDSKRFHNFADGLCSCRGYW